MTFVPATKKSLAKKVIDRCERTPLKIKCTKCQNLIDVFSSFCSFCGAKLEERSD